jgi:hypothetical protein
MTDRFPIRKQHINTQDSRDVRAVEILETNPWWQEIQESRHGGKAYGIPSSSRVDVVYHVTMSHCECEDHKYRGQVCAHIRAVRLYVNIIHSHIKRAAVGIERDLKRNNEKPELLIF